MKSNLVLRSRQRALQLRDVRSFIPTGRLLQLLSELSVAKFVSVCVLTAEVYKVLV